ncbi:unnamed protein product [Protopolystoma xenopodis]|uniref:Secreted protein n=1 Tax=Protopolystoma xenopodis TaxID=117903 RepID=A0A3S5A4X1_9PLAT|nr:unnamed protein product [Protopolystoma xenopodis]
MQPSWDPNPALLGLLLFLSPVHHRPVFALCIRFLQGSFFLHLQILKGTHEESMAAFDTGNSPPEPVSCTVLRDDIALPRIWHVQNDRSDA